MVVVVLVVAEFAEDVHYAVEQCHLRRPLPSSPAPPLCHARAKSPATRLSANACPARGFSRPPPNSNQAGAKSYSIQKDGLLRELLPKMRVVIVQVSQSHPHVMMHCVGYADGKAEP